MADPSSEVPKYHDLMNPALNALRALGGSASIAEMEVKVAHDLDLSDEAQEVAYGRMTLLGYRLAWARFYLKVFGLVTNSRRGVWALTAEGAKVESVDPKEVRRFVSDTYRERREGTSAGENLVDEPVAAEAVEQTEWREEILAILRALDPVAFENLCLRILRESGFTEVSVTRRGSDGGIDGQGIVRLQGLVSLPVVFQAKRWSTNVGAPVVRDFRGAMAGRAENGLILTTAYFTTEARNEATRPGTALIDLVDGDRLVGLMQELNLGTLTEAVERVRVDKGFFDTLAP